MRCVAIYSMKGGVGKTAAAVNLAYLAAASGLRVLLWDLDPQAASTFYLRVKAERGGTKKLLSGQGRLDNLIKASDFPRLHLLPARFSFRKADIQLAELDKPVARLRNLLKPIASDYDLVLFDCAPGLSAVSETILALSQVTLVPVIPSPLSVRTLTMLCKHLDPERRRRIHPFFSMVDRRKSLHKQVIDSNLAEPALQAQIPYATQVEQMGVHRAPLHEFAGKSPAARAYALLWEELAQKLL